MENIFCLVIGLILILIGVTRYRKREITSRICLSLVIGGILFILIPTIISIPIEYVNSIIN